MTPIARLRAAEGELAAALAAALPSDDPINTEHMRTALALVEGARLACERAAREGGVDLYDYDH